MMSTTLKESPSILPYTVRILAILINAQTNNKRISARQITDATGAPLNTVLKYLKRFIDSGLADRVKSARGKYFYKATETANMDKLGGVPRWYLNSRKPLIEHLKDVLDVENIIIEDRKTKTRLYSRVSDMLRVGCSEASERDRARQRSYKGNSFSLQITKKGVCTVTIKNEDEWQSEFREWCLSLGVTESDVEHIMSEFAENLPKGYGRIEVPVTAPNVKEAKVQLEITSLVNEDYSIKSNINYSKNLVGWEVSGPNDFLDLLVSELTMLQHKTALQYAMMRREQDREASYIV